MKILCVGFCPTTGVMCDHFLQIASGLCHIAEVSILCPDNLPIENSRFVSKYLMKYSYKKPFSFVSRKQIAMFRELRAAQFDVVFFFTQHVLNIPVALALKRFDQVMWWHESEKKGRMPLFKQLFYTVNDSVLTRTSKIIIIACEEMRKTIPMSLLPKIRVVPLPFLEEFDLDVPFDANIGGSLDLVFFGRIDSYKGLDTLGAALAILYGQDIPVNLLVIGKGDLREHCPLLLELSQRFPERIVFKNRYEPYQTIVSAISRCRAVVLPYLTAMGTGTVQIAYRQHKPVITTRVGCLKNYVQDGETGIVVSPNAAQELAEAIKLLCSDNAYAKRLGKQGYDYLLSDFMQPEITRQLQKVFSDVLNRS